VSSYAFVPQEGEQYKLIRSCILVLIHAETCENYRKITIDPNIMKLILLDS